MNFISHYFKMNMSPLWYEYFRKSGTWKKAGAGLVAIVMLLAAIPVLASMLQNTFTPRQYYFDYLDVSPAQSSFEVGEELVFVTRARIFKTVNLIWDDVLYCDLNDGLGYRLYSIYHTSRDHVPPRDVTPKPWVYHREIPLTPSTCHLQSTITAVLPYSHKVQRIIGKEFFIKKAVKYGD